eukprot:4588631-Karenia_brevis.AAC.1
MVDAVERLLPIQQEKVKRFSRRLSCIRNPANNMNCLGGAALGPKTRLCGLDKRIHDLCKFGLDNARQNFVE